MNGSPLKFSLGVSLAIHGLAIGGALLGWRHQSDVTTKVSEASTLELVAAPSSPERAIDRMFAPVSPPPPQPEIQAVIPEKPAALPLVEVAVLPQPAPLPEPSTTVAVATRVVPTVPVNVTTMPSTISGDNSSPLPGKDHTTVAGSSMTLAQPGALANLEPEYPLAARRRGQEGTVIVSVTVSTSGAVTDVVIVTSSGYELLDEAAVKFARTWKFTPAYLGPTPIESKVERPIRFKLMR